MGRRFVLVDDFDGKELPDDTQPVNLSMGRTTYQLYLSETNHGKLLKALEPFIKDAETTATHAAPARASKSADKHDKERMKAIREWAREKKIKYKNAQGEEVTLGERGRIPQEIIDQYDQAQ